MATSSIDQESEHILSMSTSQKFWDYVAPNYDRTEKRLEPIFLKLQDNVKKYLKTSDTVLDFGCGTGTISIEMAPRVNKIIALDISSNMLELAMGKTREHRIEHIEFVQATIFDERLAPGSFDVIMAFGILHLLDNIQQVMQRINELLKPGGLFISSVPCLADNMTLITRLQFYPVFLASKAGVIPQTLKRFRIDEVTKLITGGNLQLVENETIFHKLTVSFIVARKS
jgi:ubiquinone/menaquinone biosynthesis C-methylase UbiE